MNSLITDTLNQTYSWLMVNHVLWVFITLLVNGIALYLLTEVNESLIRKSVIFGICGSLLLIGVAIIYWSWWWTLVIPFYLLMWIKFYVLDVLGYSGPPVFKSKGKHRTDMIADATVTYMVKSNWSVYSELTVDRKRFDLISIDEESTLAVIEIKQANSDFYNDNKWVDYLPYCHLFYFVFPYDMGDTQMDRIVEHIGNDKVGILILERNGYVEEYRPAKYRHLGKDINHKVTLLAARKGGMNCNNWLPTRNLI